MNQAARMRPHTLTVIFILHCISFFGQTNDIQPDKIIKAHPFKIMYLDFSSDGKYLVSCGWDNTIRIWDMENFTETKTLKGHSDVVWTSVISNDDHFLVSGSQDASFILWDFKSGDLLKKVSHFPRKAKVYLDKPDGSYYTWSNAVYGLAFSNDNKTVAAGFAEGKIRIYELDSLRLLHTLEGHNSIVINIVFSKDDEIMVSSAIGKELIIWDTNTCEPLHILKGDNVYTCQFLKNEKYILSAGKCTVEIYDVTTGDKIRSFPVQCGIQNAQLFANDKYLATCGEDHTARLYDFETGKEIWRYTNPKPEVGYCIISPDEKYFVVGVPEGDILIWNLNELIQKVKSVSSQAE